MVVMPDGLSMIGAGLDAWFRREPGPDDSPIDEREFFVSEWRLERLLGVSHLRLPPDHRRRRYGQTVPNTSLTLPYLRFPQWHTCVRCGYLQMWPLTLREHKECPKCSLKGRRAFMVQVRFVAICDHGHLQDFPWNEWVHQSSQPTCPGELFARHTGSAALAGQVIECKVCGKSRTLSGITGADGDDTSALSTKLEPGTFYGCPGKEPWLGDTVGSGCGRPLRGSLRSASNLYYAIVMSAIYIPLEGGNDAPAELIAKLQAPPLSTWIETVSSAGGAAVITPQKLKQVFPVQLHDFSPSEIQAAMAVIERSRRGEIEELGDGHENEDFRRAEFNILRTPQAKPELLVKDPGVDRYADWLKSRFSRVRLVERLRETRALAGFNRVFAESGLTIANRKGLLRRRPLAEASDWLPAYVVHGEGIYLELNESVLRLWEVEQYAQDRVHGLSQRWRDVQSKRHLAELDLTPRFILVHTLSHLLMNRLTFECGYSTASLRERLYVAGGPSPMAGLLIYTAAGDSDGTLGGLVRMGKPGRFEPVLARALEEAVWCSADPVCMEAAQHSGQGPDSCNLAACHNCALVPETACEHFNRFLDRGLLIGWPGQEAAGFFQS